MIATAFRRLADIEALECTPYEQAIPARSTYGLIAHPAQRFAVRDACRYLPSGDLQQPVAPRT